MFHFQKEHLNGKKSCKYYLYKKDQQLSYVDFITLLQKDKQFRSFFIQTLSEIPYKAYRWETPPVTDSVKEQPFEFVVHDSPAIDLPPDPAPFRSYFSSLDANKGIAVFNNLGKDAKLIAPNPPRDRSNYSHLAVFTGNAPSKQQHALWRCTGRVALDLISDQPLWLNTAGGGVAWLHIRLDSRPNYDRPQPYTVVG